MKILYDIAFLTGIILPALSLIFSAFANIFDFSLNIFNVGADVGVDAGFIPASPAAVFTFLLLFGGVGRLTCGLSAVIHIPAALLSGILGGCFVERFVIHRLKQVRAESVKSEMFIGKWGIITQTIGENGYGAVTFKTKVGRSTFIAIASEPIKLGEEVEVVRCEKGKMFVKPAHPFPIENISEQGE